MSAPNSSHFSTGGAPHPSRTYAANTDPPPAYRPDSTNPRPHSHYHFDTILQSRPASHQNSPFPLTDSYFDEAFRATPSPSPVNFLDTILNPTEPNQMPFGYRAPSSPPRRRPQSPIVSIQTDAMPPTRSRPARLPSGYVDLTSMDEPPAEPVAPRRLKRQSPTPGPSGAASKRVKHNDGSSLKLKSDTPEAKIEEIDLSGGQQSVAEVLQKQREEAVKAQKKPEEKATTFNTFTCVICMDTPTDLTATACGHLFCHTCLMEALIAGENRAAPGEPKRSQCPVCRKFINRTKGTDIIPLLLKKGLVTQPRKKSVAATVPKVTS